VAPVLGSVHIPLRKRQSKDSGLSRNSGESPEYPGFTNKIVLSGDFQDSPIHPPLGDIKILSSDNYTTHTLWILQFYSQVIDNH
jgi:hypothetical protein